MVLGEIRLVGGSGGVKEKGGGFYCRSSGMNGGGSKRGVVDQMDSVCCRCYGGGKACRKVFFLINPKERL